jgi:hypothetical protein
VESSKLYIQIIILILSVLERTISPACGDSSTISHAILAGGSSLTTGDPNVHEVVITAKQDLIKNRVVNDLPRVCLPEARLILTIRLE